MTLPKKTVVYNSFQDDFAGTDINIQYVPADFDFAPDGKCWRIVSGFVYYVLALPLVYLIMRFWYGVRIKGRKNLRPVRGQGYFLYGNHTSMLDAMLPALIARKRSYVICGPDTVSIRGIKTLVRMLGAIPIPADLHGIPAFRDAIDKRISQKACVAVFPEAHIWPYCSFIREFPSTSFFYPARNGAPAATFTVTYRKMRGLYRLLGHPPMTVRISEPFYPDQSKCEKRSAAELCERAYREMTGSVSEHPGIEFIRYERGGTADPE